MYLVSKNQYENHKDIGFTKSELDNLEKYNGKEWTNKYIYVKLKYNINDFDKVTYKNTKTNDTKEIKINASDNIKYFFIPAVKENETKLTWNIEGTSSNKDISPVQNTHITQIDITPPPIPTKDNSSKEEWTNQNVTIDSESKDELSGTKILEYSTDKTNWTTLALGTTGKKTWTNAQNRNITMYIRAVDNVGNTSNESLTKIKIDIVKPNVTNIDNPQTGWTNADVNIKTTASDDLSGIAKIQYNISPGTTWSNFAITQSGLSATASKIYADAAIPLKIRTIDNAGNVSDTKSTNVKIDKIKPNSPQVSKFEFNSNVRDYRTNCIGKGDTQSDTQCNICILFTAGKKYDFSAKRSITDNGGSGLNSSAKQNIWNHNGDATKYSSWVVFPSTFGWNATKTGTYLNNIWINFGERGVDNAGNIGYALTIHYYIYDTNKTTNYNSCVSTYIK